MNAQRTTTDVAAAARYFQALADETRLRVLEMLRTGERCVCELAAGIGASQPRLSYHLRALRQAGILLDRRDGRWVFYRINPRAEAQLARLGQRLCCEEVERCTPRLAEDM
jgi:ArsR family transcriptional regulator